jgi:hypothetical protein
LRRLAIEPGTPVVLYLQSPKEKVWGVLLAADAAGLTLRGIDLATFDDWILQEAHAENPEIGPTTLFYPLHRVERMERDETVGPVMAYADRLVRETERSVEELLGLDLDPDG